MNIAFFLLPKSEVVYLNRNSTLRQALERMEYHKYSEVPVVDDDGRYVYTLTEGDILWTMKSVEDLTFETASKYPIDDIKRKRKMKSVNIDQNMMDLIELAKGQNFVPVTDDTGIFIGIVRRSEIISYCYEKLKQLD